MQLFDDIDNELKKMGQENVFDPIIFG